MKKTLGVLFLLSSLYINMLTNNNSEFEKKKPPLAELEMSRHFFIFLILLLGFVCTLFLTTWTHSLDAN